MGILGGNENTAFFPPVKRHFELPGSAPSGAVPYACFPDMTMHTALHIASHVPPFGGVRLNNPCVPKGARPHITANGRPHSRTFQSRTLQITSWGQCRRSTISLRTSPRVRRACFYRCRRRPHPAPPQPCSTRRSYLFTSEVNLAGPRAHSTREKSRFAPHFGRARCDRRDDAIGCSQ